MLSLSTTTRRFTGDIIPRALLPADLIFARRTFFADCSQGKRPRPYAETGYSTGVITRAIVIATLVFRLVTCNARWLIVGNEFATLNVGLFDGLPVDRGWDVLEQFERVNSCGSAMRIVQLVKNYVLQNF